MSTFIQGPHFSLDSAFSASTTPLRREPTPSEVAQRFGEAMMQALNQVNQVQQTADLQAERFVSGEDQDLTTLMLATEQARLSMDLTVQIRNKVLETYQEISRMPL